jgi:hypothetical protein
MKAVRYWDRLPRERLAQIQPQRLAEGLNRRSPRNRYTASLPCEHLWADVYDRVALLRRSLLTRRRMDSFHYAYTVHPRYLQYEDDIGQRKVGQIADRGRCSALDQSVTCASNVLHCQRESAAFDMKSTPAQTRRLSAYAELAREHQRMVT